MQAVLSIGQRGGARYAGHDRRVVGEVAVDQATLHHVGVFGRLFEQGQWLEVFAVVSAQALGILQELRLHQITACTVENEVKHIGLYAGQLLRRRFRL